MFSGLRQYLDFLDREGELIRIKEFVNPELEIACLTDMEAKKPGGGKALLFENTGTDFPVVTNMMGSEKRMLRTLSLESFDDLENRIDDIAGSLLSEKKGILEKLRMLPLLKDAASWFPTDFKGDAPCQEVIQFKPRLSALPVLKCAPLDGGRFITLPLVNTQSPVTGIRNVGMYRMQVIDDCTTGMHWHKHKTGAKHLNECTHRLPVAVCLGGDPIYSYAATAPLPEGVDEYLLAGFLRGKPVQLVQCMTQSLKVPADCDFVIEGYVQKSEEKFMEGPFGDHTGFYSLADLYPKFHVTCITHRKDAIYPATVVGIPPQEDKYIQLATEKIFLKPVKMAVAPEVEDLYLPEEGTGHNFAIVRISKAYEGQAFKVANALWGAGQMMFNKFLIVVDGDTDIRSHDAVKSAIEKNWLPSRDTLLSRGPMDILDHTAPVQGIGGKMCIDATSHPEGGTGRTFEEIVKFIFDESEKESSDYRKLWLVGANCDALRDCSIKGETLTFDARSKRNMPGFTREWPDIISYDAATLGRCRDIARNNHLI